MLDWYQYIPQYVSPIAFAIGSFHVRWYALSYLAGFGVVYGLLCWRIKRGEYYDLISNFKFQISNEQNKNKIRIKKEKQSSVVSSQLSVVFDFILYSFIAALIGGRIGFVLFYDLPYFVAHPLTIISPYDPASGAYVGIFGMSYHGALVGVLVAMWVFCKKNSISFWRLADFIAPAIPAGYFFGRMGNFLNGELYGRVTRSKIGMYFLQDPAVLRHPSQLYEAIGEGLVLFLTLWPLRNNSYAPGTLAALYLFGYGAVRFGIEFFRQPDPQIGLLFGFLTMGQVLSFCMMIGALLLWRILGKTKK